MGPSIQTCTRLHNFIPLNASRKLFMIFSIVEWPINNTDRYQEYTLFTELSQNLIMMSICPFLEISLKASSYFEAISFRSSSWKKGASPCVIKYANFVGPRLIFPQFCYLEASSSVNQLYFEMICIKKGFQWTFKAHNISAFGKSSLET